MSDTGFKIEGRRVNGLDIHLEEDDQFSDNEIHNVKQQGGRLFIGENEYVQMGDTFVPKRVKDHVMRRTDKILRADIGNTLRRLADKKSAPKEKARATDDDDEEDDEPKVHKKKSARSVPSSSSARRSKKIDQNK
jgi:hypothetical protein